MIELSVDIGPAIGARRIGTLGAVIDLICDPRVGLVRAVHEVKIEPGSPRFFHYAAEAANTVAFIDRRNFNRTGGAALTRTVAIAKAVGEALERYSAAIYDPQDLPLATAREAAFATARPGDFALYSDAQYASPGFPWLPFTDDTPIRWTPAVDATTGETVFVPAAFTWIPYSYQQGNGDTPIGQPISTGLACHGTAARASLSGLCEVIERDCFSITWLARCVPRQVRAETLPDDSYEMVLRLEAPGDRVVIADITSDNGIWCFLAILSSEVPSRPAYVFAASANPDPAVAVRQALEELAHTRRYAAQIRKVLPPVSSANDWEDVATQVDHLGLAGDQENRESFAFLFSSKERVSFADYRLRGNAGDAPSQLAAAVERVVATGHRVCVADLTSEDVKGLGLHVHRVVVPGYHPLFLGHHQRARGGRRLFEVPQRIGHPGIAPGGDNPIPHPYP